MIRVSVKKSIEKITKDFSNLKKPQISRAISAAINRSLLRGRTVARAHIKDRYNISQRYLQGINTKGSKSSFLTGYLLTSSRPIPMDAFSPRYEAPKRTIRISKKGVQKISNRKKARKNAAGLTIEVVRGQRKQVNKAFMIPGAKPRVFARGQYNSGGSYGFIHRNKRINKKGSDTSVKPLLSLTVFGAISNKGVQQKIVNEINPYFQNRLLHELKRQIDRIQA